MQWHQLYFSVPISALLGWMIGRAVNWRRAHCPELLIDKDGRWATVNGARLPMFCPKCEWPRAFEEKLTVLTCEHCQYTGFSAEFDQKVLVGKRVAVGRAAS